MRLRTFTAADMPSAMQMVREAMGDNAIILSSESDTARKQVTVTAAVEETDDDTPPPRRPAPSSNQRPTAPATSHQPPATNIQDIRFELQETLRFHNIPEILVAKILQRIADDDIRKIIARDDGSGKSFRMALEKMLSRAYNFEPMRFLLDENRIMLVGTAGIGKTLTIAKLATKFALEKHNLAVITTDNTRAGGIEQLQAFTNILGLELHIASNRKELEIILKSIPNNFRVLVDTAGAAPYDARDFAELKSIATTAGIEPVLVLPAGGDSMETVDIVEVFSELPVRRILVTRADATRRFGGILSAAFAHGLSFCNISRSASIGDSVQPLDSALLAQMLLKYRS